MTNPFLDRVPTPTIDMVKLRQVRDGLLRRAARGDDPVFAELAREVLGGRMTLLQAAASSAYRERLSAAADSLAEELRGVSMADIEKAAKAHPLDELLAELAEEERRDRTPKPPPPPVDDTDFDAPIMTAPKSMRYQDGGSPQRARWQGRRG